MGTALRPAHGPPWAPCSGAYELVTHPVTVDVEPRNAVCHVRALRGVKRGHGGVRNVVGAADGMIDDQIGAATKRCIA